MAEKIARGEYCDYCRLPKGMGWLHPRLPSGKADYSQFIPCPICNRPEPMVTSLTFATFEVAAHQKAGKWCTCLKAALDATMQFAEGNSMWVVLIGPHGCGKTHLAMAAKAHIQARGRPCLLRHQIDLGDELQQAIGNERRQQAGDMAAGLGVSETMEVYETIEYLIIDDYGAKMQSDWQNERMERLLNRRYSTPVLPTLLTTNLAVSQFPKAIQSRIGDRSICTIVEICAPDYRLKKK